MMMIDNRVCSKGNTPDVTKGAGIVRPVGTIEFTPIFIGVPVARSLGFCLVYLDHCLSFGNFIRTTDRSSIIINVMLRPPRRETPIIRNHQTWSTHI
jgi:hypothetical protein